jgi:hypothetical protein
MALCVLAALATGCSEDRTIEQFDETYIGLLITRLAPHLGAFVDSSEVQLTVRGVRYGFVKLTGDVPLCDSEGKVERFGTTSAVFVPENVFSSMSCDSLRIPRGEFPTDFTSGGDSLKILKNDQSLGITYDFRLARL